MEWLRRIWYLLNRRRFERLMANEMAHHREMMEREGRHGIRKNFGSELRLSEDAREVWGWMWLDRLWQDLAYGARVLRKSPGFTVTAVVVLALGIGVTLTAVRLALQEIHPSTVPDPDTLVHLERRAPGSRSTTVPYPMLAFYAEHARSFRSVIGRLNATLSFGAESEPVAAAFVTANHFSELGIQASFGRVLLPPDEAPGAEPVALLGRKFWERRFGGDPGVIGKIVQLAGKGVRVAGIVTVPKERIAVWMPLVQQPYIVEGSTLLTDWGHEAALEMSGRLKPGVAPRASEEETRALAARLREMQPKEVWNAEWLEARPFSQPDFHNASAVLVAATLVLLLLIVACTNLGVLLLARGVAREREIRTRMALGAGRRRVVRQLLTESMLLAVLSGLAALFLSTVAIKVMQARSDTPENWGATPDWRALAATVLIALVAAATFGVAPALRLTSATPRAGGSRTVFLAVQVGASCVLLMLSGLLVRGFERLMSADPGFDYGRMVVIEPGLAQHGYKGATARAYMLSLRERLLASPGVERITRMELPPWGNMHWEANEDGHRVSLNRVDAEFLQTFGLRLSAGRNFREGEQGVAIVSESLARWWWPRENPLGKTFKLGDDAVVIGVVRAAGTFNLRTEDTMGVYFAPAAKDWAGSILVARVSGRPGNYLGQFARATTDLDSRLRPNVHLLQEAYERAVGDTLHLVTTVGLMGTLATLLAAIGVAGLTAYTVGQRTREIGVRIALGAGRAQVVRAVLSPMSRPVMFGFVGGMLGAAAISSVLRKEIFGLRALDPVAYIGAIGLFLGVMSLATLAPARRATRVTASEALRHE